MALALQHCERFKDFSIDKGRYKDFKCYELLGLGLNEVCYLRYRTSNTNNTTVIRLLPEGKARSLQGVIAYGKYRLHTRDLLSNLYDVPTQWDVTAFKK